MLANQTLSRTLKNKAALSFEILSQGNTDTFRRSLSLWLAAWPQTAGAAADFLNFPGKANSNMRSKAWTRPHRAPNKGTVISLS